MNSAAALDLIYETALVPELWPRALDRIADLCGAAGGLIFKGHLAEVRLTASAELCELMERGIAGGSMGLNSRAPKAAATEHAGFIGDLDDEVKLGWAPICATPSLLGDRKARYAR